jgi:hypothetical protein
MTYSPVRKGMCAVGLDTDGSHMRIHLKSSTLQTQIPATLYQLAFLTDDEPLAPFVQVRYNQFDGTIATRIVTLNNIGHGIICVGMDSQGDRICLFYMVEIYMAANKRLVVFPLTYLPINKAVQNHFPHAGLLHGPVLMARVKTSRDGTLEMLHTCSCVFSHDPCTPL